MSAQPSVVIVGRPNVGKSTLFNAILRSRRSIVGDEPGITRDRIYGQAQYRGRNFDLIDTGGIIQGDDALIPSEILRQARVALESADHVIFLIDGRSELTGADRDLAKMLRKLGKPVALAVNKIDSPQPRGPGPRISRARLRASLPGFRGTSPGNRRAAGARHRRASRKRLRNRMSPPTGSRSRSWAARTWENPRC